MTTLDPHLRRQLCFGVSWAGSLNYRLILLHTHYKIKLPHLPFACHLHSIPPREKSTRTSSSTTSSGRMLVSTSLRLAMTDRTGGPGTPNFVHRERPEQWDEEEEIPSDGEHADLDGRAFRVRSAGPDHAPDEEESRIARQDLPFARRLTQRAEALEKVVTGMLEQPPRDYVSGG
jgi:hypothetical protein